jgi:hypothetical protein
VCNDRKDKPTLVQLFPFVDGGGGVVAVSCKGWTLF